MKSSNKLILSAAIAGIIGSGAMFSVSAIAKDAGKGHCMGANACKGKGGCKSEANECKGKNGCKGKGFTEETKAACEKLAKKNNEIKFEESKM